MNYIACTRSADRECKTEDCCLSLSEYSAAHRIITEFRVLVDWCRVLQIIDRNISNTNSGSKRWSGLRVTGSRADFYTQLKELIDIVENESTELTDLRIYSSVDMRDIKHAERSFLHKAIDNGVTDDVGRIRFYKNAFPNFVSCLMQPEARHTRWFLLDVDHKDKTEIARLDAVLEQHGVVTELRYETPNGYHLVTHGFNPEFIADFKDVEIKRNALALLYWKGKYA